MPDLTIELSHLDLANRHIVQAEANIAKTELRLEGAPDSTGQKQSAANLEVMKVTLAAFQEHRALILRTIQDIRAGKFNRGR
jgi:hypothetical protein